VDPHPTLEHLPNRSPVEEEEDSEDFQDLEEALEVDSHLRLPKRLLGLVVLVTVLASNF